MEDANLTWRKASYSSNGGGSCVEVGSADRRVLIRDTKQDGRADRATLAVPASAWQRFTDALK